MKPLRWLSSSYLDIVVSYVKIHPMVLKEKMDGRTWVWVEKGRSAALLVDEEDCRRMVWSGNPGDPIALVRLNKGIPTSLLLRLSIRRKLDLT